MRRAALLLAAAMLLGGCVDVPDAGPVTEIGSDRGGRVSDEVPAIDPEPPAPGESPGAIVDGFLDAMQASPVSTTVARLFLASSSRSSWNPERSTITYGDHLDPEGTSVVTIGLTDAHRLDGRGAWQGPLTSSASQLRFRVVVEDGEYRIADPPDALIVPQSWFDQRFTRSALYFFDPTGTVLVPEPVFAPIGETRASTLVRGLLAGPSRAARGVEQTFLPAHLDAGLSVPVSRSGLATVALTGEPAPMTRQQVQLMAAQIASTVRQDPRVRAVEITVDGVAVRLPGGETRIDVDTGADDDPTNSATTSALFGLRDGVLVSGSAASLNPVDGLFGTQPRGVRSIAVDVDGVRAAAVSDDGTSVRVGPVAAGTGVGLRTVIDAGVDLLRPSWDALGRLWLVDDTASGAEVTMADGTAMRRRSRVEASGITGSRVQRLLVSRDGSRLVALVSTPQRDRLLIARVGYNAGGRLTRVGPAQTLLTLPRTAGQIRDVAWSGPTGIAVLTRFPGGLNRVTSLGVDGAPTGLSGISTTVDQASGLIGSPVSSQALYAVSPLGLVNLTAAVRGARTDLDGATSLGYVG